MRARYLLLILLAVAGSADANAGADDTFSAGHHVVEEGARVLTPMAWRYRLLNTAQHLFDERAAVQAPGATLTFRLPKVDAAQPGNQVELVQGDKYVAMPMLSNTTFALVRADSAAQDNALVVVNRNVPKDDVNHPVVQVRSPGLPAGVRRLGDERLACAAQMAMLKAEGPKVQALFAAASLFGLDVCNEIEVTKIDDPTGPYDTVTIEDGPRRLVMPAHQQQVPHLNDHAWSDDARITYTADGHIVL